MERLPRSKITEVLKSSFYPWHCEVEFYDCQNSMRFKIFTQNGNVLNVGDFLVRRLNSNRLDKIISHSKAGVTRFKN
jgi:mRNA degradation ribonuclease J1/J2